MDTNNNKFRTVHTYQKALQVGLANVNASIGRNVPSLINTIFGSRELPRPIASFGRISDDNPLYPGNVAIDADTYFAMKRAYRTPVLIIKKTAKEAFAMAAEYQRVLDVAYPGLCRVQASPMTDWYSDDGKTHRVIPEDEPQDEIIITVFQESPYALTMDNIYSKILKNNEWKKWKLQVTPRDSMFKEVKQATYSMNTNQSKQPDIFDMANPPSRNAPSYLQDPLLGSNGEIGDPMEQGGLKKRPAAKAVEKANAKKLLLAEVKKNSPRIATNVAKWQAGFPAKASVEKAIQSAYQHGKFKHSLIKALMVSVAAGESGFKPSAKNPDSTAFGLWQIIKANAVSFGGRPFATKAADADIAHQALVGGKLFAYALNKAKTLVTVTPEANIIPKTSKTSRILSLYRQELPNNRNPNIAWMWLICLQWGAGSINDKNYATARGFRNSRLAKVYAAAYLV